jgi:hypothetical protein
LTMSQVFHLLDVAYVACHYPFISGGDHSAEQCRALLSERASCNEMITV